MRKHLTICIAALLLSLCACTADKKSSSTATPTDSLMTDSMLTLDKVYELQYKNLELAKSILQEMRSRKLASPYNISLAYADIHFNTMDFKTAKALWLEMLDEPDVQADDLKTLNVLHKLAEACELLGQKEELYHYLQELLNRAQACGNTYYQSEALFLLGKRLHYDGDHAKGIDYVNKATQLMAQATEDDHNHQLFNQLKTLSTLYANEQHLEKALQVLDQSAEVFVHDDGWGVPSEKPINQQDYYAKRASLLMLLGRTAAADSAYEAWKSIKSPSPKAYLIAGYLRRRGFYTEAIRIYEERIQAERQQGDTLGDMTLADKWNLAELYYDKGDYRRSADIYVEVLEITDTLKARTAASTTQKLETIYQTQEKERQISRRNLSLAILGAALVAIVLIALLQLRMYRTIRHKNRLMAQAIDEIIGYREATEAGQHLHEQSREDEPQQEPQGPAEDEAQPETKDDTNRRLFLALDHRIDEEQLFLNPNLNRNALCQLIGVDKNVLGNILKQYSGANNSQRYINGKRIRYAVTLMRQHPEWTMLAVAEGCGMQNTTTFNRIFRETYGMTPTEYRGG